MIILEAIRRAVILAARLHPISIFASSPGPHSTIRYCVSSSQPPFSLSLTGQFPTKRERGQKEDRARSLWRSFAALTMAVEFQLNPVLSRHSVRSPVGAVAFTMRH